MSTKVPRDLEASEQRPQKARYLSIELSHLAFHERVLHQATRADVPLLERLRFLSISSTNLDEFFEVRVSAIKQQATYGVGSPGLDGRRPREVLDEIAQRAHALVAEQYRLLKEVLLPELRRHDVSILEPAEWTPALARWARGHFEEAVLPLLTATALDPAHPFPNVVNKRLNYIVELSGADAFGRAADVAIVPIPAPRALPRLIRVPEALVGEGGARWSYLLLSAVIEHNLDLLFPGMDVRGAYQFRLTRSSELWVDEEEVDDLLEAIAGELPRRDFGDAVRLEVDAACPEPLVRFLLEEFELGSADLYRTDGPVNLHRVSGLAGEVELPALRYPGFTPANALAGADVFTALRAGDVLLHHPYQSFGTVVELLQQAARDPEVLTLKMTLYRTGADSPVVDALIEAAERGKEVTVVVELRARFDEEHNIDLAQRLLAVGANVAYGVVGRKTHAKLLVVTRREAGRLQHYAHLGTGNYHPRTAGHYTDVALMTADGALCADVHDLFRQLTGLGRLPPPRKLIAAPFALLERLLEWLERERQAALRGEPAWVVARMNALGEPAVIDKLYECSQAGVSIDLVVRGACALRPGVPGLSENIRVRSIVGRFLEHARVFAFCAGGAREVYLSSADWLARNLRRRVESCVPVMDPALQERLFEEALALYLRDDTDAWSLGPDGVYRRVAGGRTSAQASLLGLHGGASCEGKSRLQ